MPTLFSYIVNHDAGSAPNPFWGVCTLVICKPKIRLAAQEGDWIVGTGSKNTLVGNLAGKAIYVMKITDKMTLEEYDVFTKNSIPEKRPDLLNSDPRRHRGDSIFDFQHSPPAIRPGPHDEKNRKKDLSGKFALLSKQFWYFGRNAIPLPDHLLGIVKQGPGHRSGINDPFVDDFLEWISSLKYKASTLYGAPVDLDLGSDANLNQVGNCDK